MVDPSLLQTPLDGAKRSALSRAIGADNATFRALDSCDAAPIVDPTRGDTPEKIRDVFAEQLRLQPSWVGRPYDAVLYVVPQVYADKLGKRLEDRILTQQVLWVSEDFAVDGILAAYVGDEEMRDGRLVQRLLMEALGIAGFGNDLRPNIDGACIKQGSAECGKDVLDLTDADVRAEP